ncbi:MAG: peptide chain release factor N(5)-glutamine methyltransferase [Muribaculaceae bacterium]|nr:peptide chain release factor N(5)-glutamine methyltransferase [Muribaculaceae bacterium]
MRDTLKKMRDALRPIYGDREADAFIRIAFQHVKGWNHADMIIHENEQLSPFVKSELDSILQRLLKHEPIQYITGEAPFHGLTFHVSPGVLIPRPETAELVDIISDDAGDTPDLRVLDIGTGSGCIAISLARTLHFPVVSAIDVSPEALSEAKDNARALSASVNFIRADVFNWTPAGDSLDIIVSNPPYIDETEKKDMEPNVLEYEPASALFVPDSDPLMFYRRISDIALDALAEGGRLYFEINPRHADELSTLLSGKGFEDVETLKDSFGKERFIKCRVNR